MKNQQAYTIIAKYINETAPETMVQRMLYGIRFQGDMAIAMTKNHITNNMMKYWIGSVSYMSTKTNMELPPQ